MTWVANHPGKETGILVFKEQKRELVHASIKTEAEKISGRRLTVQTYSWKTRSENDVDALVFDERDVITVLNMQSCKGLEFDAVFIVDLHDASIASLGADRFRMQMFVAVSRARQWVELLGSSKIGENELFLKELPGEQYLRRQQSIVTSEVVSNESSTTVETVTNASSIIHSEKVPVRSMSENWRGSALILAKRNGWAFEDLRPKGCFWLYAPTDSLAQLGKLGFQYSARRNGWWRN